MSFESDISRWVRASQVRIDAVAKQSAQDMVALAQRTRASGGNMPVDTGNLVNSIRANTGSMPSSSSDQVTVGINRWQPASQLLYIGWAAQYAPYMDYKYGFMRLAAQQWRDLVNKNARQLRSMRGGN